MGTDWQLQNPFLNSADADRISVEGLRRTQCEQMSSELPLKADIAQYSRHVSKGPEADVAMSWRRWLHAFTLDQRRQVPPPSNC
jgi:hypothetical protein